MAICGIAGRERDKRLGDKIAGRRIGPKHSFTVGLVICVLGGVLSSLFNFGYAFGSKITDTAISLGAPRDSALNAMWLIELSSGGFINIGYCVYLFRKNRSWKLVGRASPVDWLGAWIMGLLWTASVIFYGWGANDMGRLGPTLGWSLWNAILMATTIVCGLLTGEWEGARGRPMRLLFMGITFLVTGLFTLGMGA